MTKDEMKEIKGDVLLCGNCLFCYDMIDRKTGAVNKESGSCHFTLPQVIVLLQAQPKKVVDINNPQALPVLSIPTALFPGRLFGEPACGQFIHRLTLETYMEIIRKRRDNAATAQA
jgi:hypothetical protein